MEEYVFLVLLTTNLCRASSVPLLGSAALHPEPKTVRLLLLKLLGLRPEGLLLLLLPAPGTKSEGVLRLLLLLVRGGVQVPALRPVLAAARIIQNQRYIQFTARTSPPAEKQGSNSTESESHGRREGVREGSGTCRAGSSCRAPAACSSPAKGIDC